MAKAPTRTPVTERGAALLALISGAPNGVLMLTQEEGLDAINAGHAVVDTSNTAGDTAAVSLTDAGRAALSGAGGASAKFNIRTDIEMPQTATQRRGRQSSYPFDALPLNGSFHVPVKDGENIEKLSGRLASSISGARARYTTETGETRKVKVNDYQRDADGKIVKGEDGKRVVTGTREVERPVKENGRDFKLAVVDANDPDGAGVRVWRTL